MVHKIEKLKDIATHLERHKEFRALENIEQTLNNNQFFLAVFGQFSAGKSRLLNNLLENQILPVRVTETTAFLTFIKYGETTNAKIVYTDGQVQGMQIETVQALFEGAQIEGIRSYEEIDYIEVYVPSPLLQTGLVLVDTPGVNTLISRHQKLATSVIQASGRIIYVMGKALSDTDQRFIEMIKASQVDITFVRTKMDEIKLSEESYEDVISRDKAVLAPFLGESKLYHVSNEITAEKWYGAIKTLHHDLCNEIVVNIDTEIKKSCNKQLELVSDKLKELLIKEKQTLIQLLEDEVGNAEEKQLYYSNLICELEERLESKSKSYKAQIQRMQKDVEGQLVEIQEQAYRNAERNMFSVPASSQASQQLAQLSQGILFKTGERFSNAYTEALDGLVMGARDEIDEMTQELNLNSFIDVEEMMPDSFEALEAEALDEEMEIQHLKKQMSQIYNNIDTIDEQIAQMSANEQELARFNEEFVRSADELQEALKKYANYEPRYQEAEGSSLQVSEVMRKIGGAADIATFFLPGGTIAKGTMAILKSPAVVKRTAKLVGLVEKAAQGIKKADTVKDTLFVLQKMKDSKVYTTVRRQKKANDILDKVAGSDVLSNILDKFTFAHWFEVAGKPFDQPIKMEVDKEYERAFFEEKNILTEQYKALQNEELKRKEECGCIRNEIERQNEARQIEERRAKELAERLEKRKVELYKELEEKAFKELKANYLRMLAQEMKQLRSYIANYYNEKIEEKLEVLLLNYNERLIQRLEITKERQNQLLEQLQSGNKESLESAIAACSEYLEEIA